MFYEMLVDEINVGFLSIETRKVSTIGKGYVTDLTTWFDEVSVVWINKWNLSMTLFATAVMFPKIGLT